MQERTVTESVRELLKAGLTSREIIDKGYAPGTVYKVQRSLRLAAALAQEQPPGSEPDEWHDSDPEPRLSSEDDGVIASRVGELEAEIVALREEVGNLRSAEDQRLSDLERTTADLKSQVAYLEHQLASARQAISWLRSVAEDAVILLMEPPELLRNSMLRAAYSGQARERMHGRLGQVAPDDTRAILKRLA